MRILRIWSPVWKRESVEREKTWLNEMVSEIEVLPQKIVDAKTVVLKTRLDPNLVRLRVEGLKQNFFAGLGFFKPKAEEIQLVGYEKYYEPYIVTGGKYSLDYCRKHAFSVEVEKTTDEVFIAGKKFEPIASKSGKNLEKRLHLEGEEHAHYERESFFLLDRFRREISPESFSFAPHEEQLDSVTDLNLRRISISVDEIIKLLRSKIAKRPADLAEIIRENFEINENTIVYRPFFEFTFHRIKTKKHVTLRVDGVSGEKVLYRFDTDMFRSHLGSDKTTDYSAANANLFSANSKQPIRSNTSNLPKTNLSEPHKIPEVQSPEKGNSDENVTLKFPANVGGEVLVVGDNVTAVVGDLEIPSGVAVNDTLVVKGKLKIGDKCRLSRNVKVLGDVTVGIATVIYGDVVSGGNVAIGSNSVIGGRIRAAGAIEISERVVVGKELNPDSDLPQESFDLKMIVDSEKEKTLV